MDFSWVIKKRSYLFLWMAVLAEDGLGGALAILVCLSDVLLLLICGFWLSRAFLGMANARLPPVFLMLLCLP